MFGDDRDALIRDVRDGLTLGGKIATQHGDATLAGMFDKIGAKLDAAMRADLDRLELAFMRLALEEAEALEGAIDYAVLYTMHKTKLRTWRTLAGDIRTIRQTGAMDAWRASMKHRAEAEPPASRQNPPSMTDKVWDWRHDCERLAWDIANEF